MADYPTEEELRAIEEWDFIANPGFSSYMQFIRSIWWSPKWSWHEEDDKDDLFDRSVYIYNISTGGWSGNEDIIEAMHKNFLFWSLCWVQSRRGGHYIFHVDNS